MCKPDFHFEVSRIAFCVHSENTFRSVDNRLTLVEDSRNHGATAVV